MLNNFNTDQNLLKKKKNYIQIIKVKLSENYILNLISIHY